jgi:hypothetical protein
VKTCPGEAKLILDGKGRQDTDGYVDISLFMRFSKELHKVNAVCVALDDNKDIGPQVSRFSQYMVAATMYANIVEPGSVTNKLHLYLVANSLEIVPELQLQVNLLPMLNISINWKFLFNSIEMCDSWQTFYGEEAYVPKELDSKYIHEMFTEAAEPISDNFAEHVFMWNWAAQMAKMNDYLVRNFATGAIGAISQRNVVAAHIIPMLNDTCQPLSPHAVLFGACLHAFYDACTQTTLQHLVVIADRAERISLLDFIVIKTKTLCQMWYNMSNAVFSFFEYCGRLSCYMYRLFTSGVLIVLGIFIFKLARKF